MRAMFPGQRMAPGLVVLVALSLVGCGLDVTFEPEQRDNISSYDPARDRNGLPEEDEPEDNNTEQPQTSLTSFSHAAWGASLRAHLTGACVDYEGIGASGEALDLLGTYADQLSRADLDADWTVSSRVAFWVNAYNALTVLGVTENRLEDADFQVDDDGFVFFDRRRWEVGGMILSLDLIEHGVLRGDLSHDSMVMLTDEDIKAEILREHEKIGDFDPRLHFAINCASRSCPDLRGEPFSGDKLEAQLAHQTALFLADPDKGAGPDGISMLFLWFAPDFEAQGDIPDLIEGWRPEGLEGVKLDSYLSYSWAPNEVDLAQAQCQAE